MQRALLPFTLAFGLAYGVAAPMLCSQKEAPAAALARALDASGANRAQLDSALERVPKEQIGAMRFLIAHMPKSDLRALDADFLLENVALAHKAYENSAWKEDVPREIFLNDVLPYANVTERRERWRRDFHERFAPLVRDCKTPGEAAQLLNRKIFGMLGVRYSTKRKRADQSPSESIETGMASCTGLSILLVDACRAVGAPARLVGIPSWPNKRGNHTWVEIWDGRWRYLGAAEPGEFDKTWFSKDAALARADAPQHSIYAVRYQKTGLRFPMVWSRRGATAHAVNVTRRYATAGSERDKTRLMIRVRSRENGPRIDAQVEVHDLGATRREDSKHDVLRGTSKTESSDTNDILSFDVPRKRSFEIRVSKDGRERKISWSSADRPQAIVDVILEPDTHAALARKARAFFEADEASRAEHRFDPALERLLLETPDEARRIAWQAYRSCARHDALRADFAAKRVRAGEHESPYTWKVVGKKPAKGWPLFIAMHGGGGVAKRFNDSQWRHMQIYYRDQKELEGYIYIALRAPNDTWNGFYDHYVWPLVSRLTRQARICEDIDPDKVFLMGYSHGGYGAFAIGPNIPDHFAAIHASAAAPTPGLSPAANLRNVRFTFMIGEKDTRYGRLERCRAFDAEVQKLRGARRDIYPVTMEFEKGRGHGGLPDRNKIKQMYASVRAAMPRDITWRSTGSTVRDFYWLHVPSPKSGHAVDATCRDNEITIRSEGVRALSLGLDERLIDLEKPVRVRWQGKEVFRGELRPSLAQLCRSIERRGDPALATACRVDLRIQ